MAVFLSRAFKLYFCVAGEKGDMAAMILVFDVRNERNPNKNLETPAG